jgi:hypothetical protein
MQTYKHLFSVTTGVSTPTVTALRNRLSTYAFFVRVCNYSFLNASFVNSSSEVTLQISFVKLEETLVLNNCAYSCTSRDLWQCSSFPNLYSDSGIASVL